LRGRLLDLEQPTGERILQRGRVRRVEVPDSLFEPAGVHPDATGICLDRT
jgi:hypothetical protein